ncbi:MAG: protein kinase domain-containing protein [Bellilinea sp.]
MDDTKTVTPVLGNRYQLIQAIGNGGMAVVYHARDLMLERPVAIKILRQDYSKNEAFRERFRLEARSAANLSHPNIVTVHDFGFDSDRLYLVMEYVPGTDLKTILKDRVRLPVAETVNIIVQASSGIGYAHRAGLIHCDVKPHNMLVTPDHRVKVTDFGIARAMASIQPDEKHDVVWGSPLYFSPEQAAGGAPSPASDVYSLGVVLYELLTGRLPFNSSDPSELAKMHREAVPIPPRKLNPEIPVALEQIIMKVLAKEPSSRYRTADQLGRVLSSFLQTLDSASQVSTTVRHLEYSQPNNPAQSISDQVFAVEEPSSDDDSESFNIDWGTISLALAAIVAVGGLIPFWLWIWFTFNPPTP